MQKAISHIFFTFILLFTSLQAKDLSLNNDSTINYTLQRYSEIANNSKKFSHRRLDVEKKYFKVKKRDYFIVDKILKNAKNNKILKENLTKNSLNKKNIALAVKTIHNLIRKEGFICEEEPILLYRCLESQILSCTTYSTIYRDIFKEFGIKTGLVVVPGHAFIRVLFEEDNYFNIETISGKIKSDFDYKTKRKISSVAIDKGVFLKTLNNKETVSIWYLSNAIDTYNLKQIKTNIRILKKAIRIYPKNIVAHENLGFAYDKLNKFPAAMKEYNKAISLNPNSYFAHLGKGNVYRKLGRIAKSIEQCTKAITLKSDYYDAIIARASMYFISKKYNKAILDYAECISLKPEISDNYITKGSSYFFLKQYDKALKEYNIAIMLSPENSVSYHIRGEIFNILKRYSESISDYNKSIELDFDGSKKNTFGYKNKNYNLKAYIKRIKSMKEQLAQDSVYIKAEILKNESIKNKSVNFKYFKIKNYTKQILLDPKNGKAYYDRARTYIKLKKYDKAIADLNTVIMLIPNQYMLYFFRAFAYDLSRNYTKAIVDYTKAITINPYDSFSYSLRAKCYLELKLYDKAIVDFKQSFSLDPKDIDNLIDFAWFYFLRNEPDNAFVYLKKGFEIDKEEPYIQTKYVVYFLLKNNFLKAKSLFMLLDKTYKEDLISDIFILEKEGISNMNFEKIKEINYKKKEN